MAAIDLFKCNNLRWKSSDDSGFIKTDGKEFVYLFSDRKVISQFNGMSMNALSVALSVDDIQRGTWRESYPDFRIVCRDPESYMDWQVGDVVRMSGNGKFVKIGTRIEDIVVLISSDKFAGIPCTCEELFDDGGRLELKEYERSFGQGMQIDGTAMVTDRNENCEFHKINEAAQRYAPKPDAASNRRAFCHGAEWMMNIMKKWLNRKEQEVTWSDIELGHGLLDGWDYKFENYLKEKE